MASYIGKVTIGSNTYPVGSTLYGTCSGTVSGDTTSYSVSLANFDKLETGITIHVKFTTASGTATKLKVGSTDAKSITNPSGAVVWAANSVVSFTYDGTNWIMNDGKDTKYTAATSAPGKVATTSAQGTSANYARQDHTHGIDLATGDNNGQVKIAGSNVSVKGLAGAAYKAVDTSITAGSTSTNVPTSAAVASLISTATSGLTGAMHFKGTVSSLPSATDNTTYSTYAAGDVILVGDKEYVYNKGNNAAGSSWILLGDEGSYALKTSTAEVVKTATLTKNTLPTLTITTKSIPNITSVGTPTTLGTAFSIPNVTNKGSAAEFTVANGILTLKAGSAPTLGTAFTVPNVTSAGTVPTLGDDISVGSASGWNAGTQASLSTTNETVVKP